MPASGSTPGVTMTDPYSPAEPSDDLEERDDLNGGDAYEADDADAADAGYDDEEPAYGNTLDTTGDDLRDLVHFVASSLVDRPEEVEVHAAQRGQSVHLTLVVPDDELGKVIGRGGRIARAIRTVTMIAGSRHNVRASLDIEG